MPLLKFLSVTQNSLVLVNPEFSEQLLVFYFLMLLKHLLAWASFPLETLLHGSLLAFYHSFSVSGNDLSFTNVSTEIIPHVIGPGFKAVFDHSLLP